MSRSSAYAETGWRRLMGITFGAFAALIVLSGLALSWQQGHSIELSIPASPQHPSWDLRYERPMGEVLRGGGLTDASSPPHRAR